jgi:hypothetical protein
MAVPYQIFTAATMTLTRLTATLVVGTSAGTITFTLLLRLGFLAGIHFRRTFRTRLAFCTWLLIRCLCLWLCIVLRQVGAVTTVAIAAATATVASTFTAYSTGIVFFVTFRSSSDCFSRYRRLWSLFLAWMFAALTTTFVAFAAMAITIVAST